jgi:hypothetical protein
VFDFTPLTFVLEVDSNHYPNDLERFEQYFNQIENMRSESWEHVVAEIN